MNTFDSLTEIGRAMERAQTEPVSIADVIAVINRNFARMAEQQRAGKLSRTQVLHLLNLGLDKSLDSDCKKNSSTVKAVPDSGSSQKMQSQTEAGCVSNIPIQDILRAAGNGLETAVPDYTEE